MTGHNEWSEDWASEISEEPLPRGGEYRLRRLRETTRTLLAVVLVALLGLIAVAYPVSAAVLDDDRWTRVEPTLTLLFSGLTGLTGAAIAFYFTASRD